MRPTLFILLLLLALPHSLLGQELESQEAPNSGLNVVNHFLHDQALNGSIRFDYFSSSKLLDNTRNFYGATAQLKYLATFGDTFGGKVEARFTDPDTVQNDRIPSAARVLEGYLIARVQNIDVSIGKQILSWGRADAINPTDNLTPSDYTVLLPFRDDQRFGTSALQLNYYVTSNYKVIIFAMPQFEPSKIPLPILPDIAVRQRIPAHTFTNTGVALKLDKSGEKVDWSVSYFHGFNLLPELRFIERLPASPVIELRYPKIDVIGADMARNYGRYGFRVEAAYFYQNDYSSQEPTMIQPYLYYVLGADRTFFENMTINVQLIGHHVQHFKNPEAITDPTQRSLAVENAILFSQQNSSSYGFTSRISDKWINDTLETEMFFIVYFNPKNWYLRPLVTYAFTDWIKGSIGGEIFSGHQDSYFGLLKPNRVVFAELRYRF
jgi:hypothetical protein